MTIWLLLSAFACTSGTEDTGDTGTYIEPVHPNIPEGYEYKWSPDGCTQYDGSEGSSVYLLAEGYAASDGEVHIDETWYWFHGGDWSQDCIDAWSYDGEVSHRSPASFGASEAEQILETTMSLPSPECGILYYMIFDQEKTDYEEQEWPAWVVLEYLTSWGNPNEKLGIFMLYGVDGYDSADFDYAVGAFSPDTEEYDLPAHFTWEGNMCIGSG